MLFEGDIGPSHHMTIQWHVDRRELSFLFWSRNRVGCKVSVRGLAGKVFLCDIVRLVTDQLENLPGEILSNPSSSP